METSSVQAAPVTGPHYRPSINFKRQARPAFLRRHPSTVAGGRSYSARALADIAGLRNCCSPFQDPRTWKELEVRVPMGSYTEFVQARYRQVGVSTLEGAQAERLQAFEVRFTTQALGLGAPVQSTLIVEVSDQLQTDAALSQVIQEHVKAVSRAGLDGLEQAPKEYHVRPDAHGMKVERGYSGGRFERLQGAELVDVGNRLGAQPVEEGRDAEDADGNLTLRLSSGKSIKTTATRLERARQLAQKITFVVRDDGTQVKASAAQIEKVARRLAAHSLEDMDLLERENYKVLLVNSKRTPRGGYPGGRAGAELADDSSWNPHIRGYVRSSHKVIVLPAEALDEKAGGGSDVLLHELGHALSDLRVDDGYKHEIFGFGFGPYQIRDLDRSGPVMKLFEAYAKRCGYDTSKGRNGTATRTSAIWSGYALAGPQEYLAEGITFYQQGGADRQVLKDKDPEFFEYLKALLD